jgi:hypothetical protein
LCFPEKDIRNAQANVIPCQARHDIISVQEKVKEQAPDLITTSLQERVVDKRQKLNTSLPQQEGTSNTTTTEFNANQSQA